MWDEILAMKAPNPKLVGLTGGYLYCRALALAARGQLDESRSTLQQLKELIAATPADAPAGTNTIRGVLAVGVPIVEARISAAAGHADAAVAFLQQAVQAEDQLAYNEPRDWFVPARQVLGAQLLRMNRPGEAEAVYREDLKQNPANGWALFGLSAALKAQGKSQEASQTAQQFAAAWKRADVTLTASAY
jgi:tetratricopeptide (TPR) repeat protein